MESKTVVKNLRIAIFLTASILVFEIAGGIISGSLALLADAAHVFTDVVSLSLSLGVLLLSRLPSTEKKTFGWHRAEIFTALFNSLMLIGVCCWIFYEAVQRIVNPREVIGGFMLAVAVVGLGVNLFVMLRLRAHQEGDLNIRSSYLHVLGDLLGSIAVVTGAIFIWIFKVNIIDPLISMGIIVIILTNSVRILRESFNILMEGVPKHIKVNEVSDAINSVSGVENIHDVHIWAVCSHIVSLSCYVNTTKEWIDKREEIINNINRIVKDRFRITHATIQVGCAECKQDIISQDLKH